MDLEELCKLLFNVLSTMHVHASQLRTYMR